jgi:hypothetical protein
MKKTLTKAENEAQSVIQKTKITVDDLNSSAFTFDEQMLYQPSSKLNDLKHW